jgi:autotransporter-associated beta strand protein
VALKDNVVVTVGSGKSLAFSGIVSNTTTAKTILFNGAGTNILSGANSYGPAAGSVGTTVSTGGTLRLGNSSALGAGDLSVSGNSTLAAGAAVSVGNNIAIADMTTVDSSGNNFTLGGVISGAGGLTKTGNGTLTLNGNNTYAGNTTVNAGTLSLSSPNNVLNSPNILLNGGGLLGSATFTAANNIGIGAASGSIGTNALIDAASGQVVTLSGVIGTAGNGGTDGLLINSGVGNGTVVLGGANTFNGPTVIANGALQLANTLALQNSTLNYSTGTLLFDSSISAATLGGLLCANGSQNIGLTNLAGGPVALTIGGNNAAIIYGGNLSDGGLGGSLIKAGTGTLTLSNANYTGGTTINAGSGAVTILAGNFGSASSAITVGAQLSLTGATATASAFNLATVGGQTGVGATISGTANLTNTATTIGSGGNTAGAMTLNTAGNVNLGNVKINKDGGNVTVGTTGAGLLINGGNVIAASVNIGQSGTALRGEDLNINGGTLTIADASQTGMFAVHSGAGSGFLTQSGGTLNYLGTDGLQMSIGAGTSVAVISGGMANLTGVTLNSGSAATTSTLTVDGTNNPSLYLGNVGLVINLPSPTVAATFGNATIGALADWASDAPITLTNNPVFKAADAANVPHSITLSNILSGTGNLTKTGTGALTLMGANTYTGNTIVRAGTLDLLQASLFTNSTVSVSNSATLALDFSGTNLVAGLILNGVSKAAGVYGNNTDPTFLTGTGYLQVQPLVSPVPTNITTTVSGNTLTLSWPADHLGWHLQLQTNSLAAGLGTNWVTLPGSDAVTSTNLTIDAANGSVFFRMVHP